MRDIRRRWRSTADRHRLPPEDDENADDPENRLAAGQQHQRVVLLRVLGWQDACEAVTKSAAKSRNTSKLL